MLRKVRIAIEVVFLIGITLLFFGIGLDWWGWMAKLQFLPACLGLSFLVIAGVVVATLLFGRIYCSTVCPMGALQDVVISVHGKISPKTLKFIYKKESRILRFSVFALFVLCIVLGAHGLVALLAPYSAYGRMVKAVATDSPWQLILVAALSFVVIVFLSWKYGRIWCTTFCPVGTALSIFSRVSVFKPVIDTDKCINCGKCARNCKASCIDVKHHSIDYSKCVDCFDCIDNCSSKAVSYKISLGNSAPQSPSEPKSESRRGFLKSSAAIAGIAAVESLSEKTASAQLHGGLAEILPKTDPQRSVRLTPPGSVSPKQFYQRCTGCNLCVSNCPNGVLRTSTDLEHLLQPYMSYADGYCRPECNTCSTLCPAGAILPLEKFEKLNISIGIASVDYDSCLASGGVCSGNCARHCPVGAIRMVENTDGVHIPVVNEERCIGCGACENLCPVRPLSAITVNGRLKHQVHE